MWTSGTESQIMANVDWIPSFRLLKQNGFTFIGDIPYSTWNNCASNPLNSFIATTHLRPSRYAMAYIPPTQLNVYVNVAFIALDNENLHENVQEHSL
jgi:hypothetical protein